jgi:Ca2+-binding RTX toxin-like protein
MTEIYNTPETNVYVKPIIDYDKTGTNPDPTIILDSYYISSQADSNNVATALTFLGSVLASKLGSFDDLSVLTAQLFVGNTSSFVKLTIDVNDIDNKQATISLCNIATGVALVALPVVLEKGALGLTVLSNASKSNIFTTAVGFIVNEIVSYEVIAEAYRNEYAIQYERANVSGDIIVNATGYSFDTIKKFLYYSDVLKQSEDVYVQQGTEVYKVVRGSEYDAIVTELARRGYYGGDDATNPYNDADELNELQLNSADYRQSIDELTNIDIQASHVYKDEKFLLIKSNAITFPFQGNIYDNIIFLDDVGRASYGGAGDDSITGGTGNDTIYGDQSPFLYGTVGNGKDSLIGGAGSDNIDGDDGADLIYGDDSLTAVSTTTVDNDSIYGGIGNDSIYGGQGRDTIHGGADNDLIYGDNVVINENVDDTDLLYGDAGNDTIYGGYGTDVLNGGDNNDQLYGGIGNVVLIGGTGADKLYGGDGAGNDINNLLMEVA